MRILASARDVAKNKIRMLLKIPWCDSTKFRIGQVEFPWTHSIKFMEWPSEIYPDQREIMLFIDKLYKHTMLAIPRNTTRLFVTQWQLKTQNCDKSTRKLSMKKKSWNL